MGTTSEAVPSLLVPLTQPSPVGVVVGLVASGGPSSRARSLGSGPQTATSAPGNLLWGLARPKATAGEATKDDDDEEEEECDEEEEEEEGEEEEEEGRQRASQLTPRIVSLQPIKR